MNNYIWPDCVGLGQFFGLRGRASNLVSGNTSTYTKEMFFEDFPQFTKLVENQTPTDPPTYTQVSLLPESMLNTFIIMANAAILEKRWFEKWRYAMGLFIAHYSAMYLSSYRPAEENTTPSDASSSGAVVGVVQSASLGDASVSYDVSAISTATDKWGAWNSTTYGQTLVTEARLIAAGGTYVI